MVSDIIIVSVIVLFILIGVKRGIAKTFLNIVGYMAVVSLAYFLSGVLSQFIYDVFVKQTVITNIEQTISETGVQSAMHNCLNALPGWVFSLVSFVTGIFGLNTSVLTDFMKMPDKVSAITANSIESMVAPVAVSVFKIFLEIILFVILLIIVKKLIRVVLRIFNIPVIRQVNQSFGGVLGAVEGILFVWLAVNIFYVIMFFSNPEVTANSLVAGNLFKFFCIAV